jgi:hypothetical protein
MDSGNYTRELEAYLCRKNDGHLIRIAGPAFEKVRGWAEQGIPFKVACQGIDRYFERYYSKGPRRRPVRIEFCEADVLDAFDEWRRAVGMTTSVKAVAGGRESRVSLPAHLQRVVLKLTSARAIADDAVAAVLDRSLNAIEELRSGSGSVRGEARARAVRRLAEIDRELIEGVRSAVLPAVLGSSRREAEEELAGFAARMSPATYANALEGATDRLLRGRLGLPRIEYGG